MQKFTQTGEYELRNLRYYEDDDILVQRFSDNPISREVSQDWNIHISYDKSGRIVQIVILEAKQKGLYPVTPVQQAA